MKACLYARTCQKEKRYHTTSIPRQIEICRELAGEHNLTIHVDHTYFDSEYPGHLPPTCWAREDEDGRPALAAMLSAIENGELDCVVVHRIENLSTASETLEHLRDLFVRCNAYIIAPPDVAREDADPVALFAYSILKSRIQIETEVSRERREKQISKKREEIVRLQSKIRRIEAEIAAI